MKKKAKGIKMIKVKYRSNNSGGDWWLDDEDWFNLEKAGWEIEWVKDDKNLSDKNGRFLGALAVYASKMVEDPEDAIREFEKITGQSGSDSGCSCCGRPHSFNWEGGSRSGDDDY